MDAIFQALSSLPPPTPQVHVVVDNVATAAEATPYNEALVAIASVAAVLWTGGLIIRQLFPTYLTMIVQNGMFFTMFATFASIGGLITHGNVLRVMAALFFLRYAWLAIVGVRRYRLQLARKEPLPNGLRDEALYFKSFKIGNRLEGCLLIFYLPLIILPTAECVAWTTFFAAFFGYQMILGHLSQAKWQDDGLQTIAGSLQRVLQHMDRWNSLMPELPKSAEENARTPQ